MNSTKSVQLYPVIRSLQLFRKIHVVSCLHNESLPEQSSTTEVDIDNEDKLVKQWELMKKRNKSLLEQHHYNIQNSIPTPISDLERDTTSLREVRAAYGRDGAGCGVDPKYLWPSKQELELMKECEQVVYPLSLPDMMAKSRQDKDDAITFAANRQMEIRRNMKSLNKWKETIRNKIVLKEKEQLAEKEKRDRLIDEVRLMLGVRISPYDERFQEIVAQKELEERKAEKAIKKQQKQQKMLDQMKKLAEASRVKVEAEKEVAMPAPVLVYKEFTASDDKDPK